MLENRQLEFKEKISDSFLKTVSAYANYDGGVIKFGIDDNGILVGLTALDDNCITIENKINDGIIPQPEYGIEIDRNCKLIILTVQPGEFKPYTYRGKAYVRKGTSTTEVDRVEYNRLVLYGLGQSFDQQISRQQKLQFKFLSDEMSRVGVKLDATVLRTLNLCDVKGRYNLAALLLADRNTFYGTDCMVFGETLDIIKGRKRIEGKSVLEMFAENIDEFSRNYKYEKIVGTERKVVERIPEKAFREALANALVHRRWDTDTFIQISMYEDRVEIVSPGGLPSGISEAEYLQGKLSNLRNPILANVFFRLGYIEMFGTGIKRIKRLYSKQNVSPRFEIGENTITVILPVVGEKLVLSNEEEHVYSCLTEQHYLSSGDLVKMSGYSKAKVLRILEKLLQKKYVTRTGIGRGIKYGL